MPEIDVTVWIDAPLDKVYAIAKDSASFPLYMKDVQSITPVETDGSKVISDWVGIVPTFGLKLRWRQQDDWNDELHECRFRQVTGDYDKMEGTWIFKTENNGTRFDTHLEYEYNVPTLGPLVKKVIYNIVLKNLESIGEAFKKRAEA